MRNPGDKRIESAIAWAARREDTGVVEMYLESMSAQGTHQKLERTNLCSANARSTSVTTTEPRWKQIVAQES
jgi:hypothetical protein